MRICFRERAEALTSKWTYRATWWLRTPGGEENWRMAVETDGCPSVEGYSAERGEISVRPAMWLDLGRLSLLNEDGGNKPE